MKIRFTIFCLMVLLFCNWSGAQNPVGLLNKPAQKSMRLFMAPCSTRVSLGKASLVASPLTHKGAFYVGDYQLKVLPYFFKSERGTLALEASDDLVKKLMEGIPIEFVGKAADNKNGKPKEISGKATPSTTDQGSVTFSIATENGTMIFNTFYRFSK